MWLQYLIQDLMYITVLAALMALALPASKLACSRPASRLMSCPVLAPVAAQLALVLVLQVGMRLVLSTKHTADTLVLLLAVAGEEATFNSPS